jgi:mannose/fructose/N-acetylgalactosamine-specific phosphotransferase system component IIB
MGKISMDVQLFRIDDRLIHGQVVLGWAKYLDSRRIILCDALVADNTWERELYLSCVPADLEALILNIGETSEYLTNNNVTLPERTIVLVKSPGDILQLADQGFLPSKINLGGLHFSDDRKRYLSYLFMSEEEVAQLRSLAQKGCEIICQDVPTGRRYNLEEVLG